MSIRSGDPTPPAAGTSVPHGTLRDLLLSMAFIVSGPVLWCFSTAILADQPDQPGQPDLRMRLGQLSNLHGMDAAEALIGLLAAASGLLISIGAAVSVLAVLSQQVARRCSAWRMEQLLSQFSPGFLRRSAVLTLGAGLTLTGVAADSWPRMTTTTEVTATLDDRTESRASDDAADTPPDSALFDTTGPGEAPSPDADPPETPPSAQDPDPVPEQDPDPHPRPERGASSGTGDESDSGLLTPEEPNTDRLQGLPQRRGAEPEQVVVRLGDSLWEIAADHLGADATDWEIAASWPRWYEANRQRIGTDPGIILPGTILCVPSR